MYVTKMQAYQQKTEKFFVSGEKMFGSIDSCNFSVLFLNGGSKSVFSVNQLP